jgi:hypothetical protein
LARANWMMNHHDYCHLLYDGAPEARTCGDKLILGFAVTVCVVSLAALLSLIVLIWLGWFSKRIDLNCFYEVRKYLAVFTVGYALMCIGRLAVKVAIPRDLPQKLVLELVLYSIFWVLAPPLWFFAEYFAVASDWIGGLPVSEADKAGYLKTIKDYADYASKIWAGVLALLLGLIALKK